MDIEEKKIWQVAAGETNRNYADLCLKWDVILNGPGIEGPWPECQMALKNKWELSPKKIRDLQRFAEEIADGDYIVLRIGSTDVFGVGIVVGEYEWHEEFGEVDGWDLNHIRRVKWLWQYNEIPKRFDTYTLRLGDAVQAMDSQPLMDWISDISIDKNFVNRPLVELPSQSKSIERSANE